MVLVVIQTESVNAVHTFLYCQTLLCLYCHKVCSTLCSVGCYVLFSVVLESWLLIWLPRGCHQPGDHLNCYLTKHSRLIRCHTVYRNQQGMYGTDRSHTCHNTMTLHHFPLGIPCLRLRPSKGQELPAADGIQNVSKNVSSSGYFFMLRALHEVKLYFHHFNNSETPFHAFCLSKDCCHCSYSSARWQYVLSPLLSFFFFTLPTQAYVHRPLRQ